LLLNSSTYWLKPAPVETAGFRPLPSVVRIASKDARSNPAGDMELKFNASSTGAFLPDNVPEAELQELLALGLVTNAQAAPVKSTFYYSVNNA
jgi:hypothetical protein